MENNSSVSYFYHFGFSFFISLLAWPITYFFNYVFEQVNQTMRPFWMMTSGFLILVTVLLVISVYSYVHDWVYYGSVLFAFTAVIDLIITLEFNGVIDNFMSEYLKLGEPYLASSWGSAIALFDGIGFYLMYLFLAHFISNSLHEFRESWRSLGIYWSAGLINAMLVLLLCVFSGKYSPTFCTFLNVPYVLFPILVLIRVFKKEERPEWNFAKSKIVKGIDIVLSLCLGGCVYIALAKGITALAPENPGVDFIHFVKHEPSFLFDVPGPFSKIQAIVYLLYIVPLQLVSIVLLLTNPVPSYIWEITLIQAGVLIQGQFSTLGVAFDPQTPTAYKSQVSDAYFWFYNLFLVATPHIVLLRLKLCNNDIAKVNSLVSV